MSLAAASDLKFQDEIKSFQVDLRANRSLPETRLPCRLWIPQPSHGGSAIPCPRREGAASLQIQGMTFKTSYFGNPWQKRRATLPVVTFLDH